MNILGKSWVKIRTTLVKLDSIVPEVLHDLLTDCGFA